MGTLDLGSKFRGFNSGENGGNFSTGGASHLIRSAEKLASSGRFEFAIEQLAVAKRLDPGNQYIQAIIDRIRVAQNLPAENTVFDELGMSQGPLQITVDPRSPSGIKSEEDEQTLSPEDMHGKIRSLTNLAEQFLESGSSEKAFDSLMKAYLLDPLSPYVVASEKAILPAWESTKSQIRNTQGITQEMVTQKNMDGFSKIPARPAESPEDKLRVEMLRQQKEQERLERERAEWRDASKPLKVFGEEDTVSLSTPQPPVEQPKPQSTGLFSKLRLGKFLE